MDLLSGHLEFIKYKAEKSREILTDELPILTETKYHNQTRYVIKDKELEGFIKICVILFAQDVYSILEYLYSLNESQARRASSMICNWDRKTCIY